MGDGMNSLTLQQIKMTVSSLWVLIALIILLVINPSTMGTILLAGLGLIPPLFVLLLWNDPAQTMSESINQARR